MQERTKDGAVFNCIKWTREGAYGDVEVLVVAGEHGAPETHDGVRVVLVGVDQVVILLRVQHALSVGQSVAILIPSNEINHHSFQVYLSCEIRLQWRRC